MSETESACACVRGCSQISFFLLTISVFSEAALLGMFFSSSFPKNFLRGFLVWTVLMLPKALKDNNCSCLQEHCQLLEQEHKVLCCLFTTFLFRTSSLDLLRSLWNFLSLFFFLFFPVLWKFTSQTHPNCKSSSLRTPSLTRPFPAPSCCHPG